MVILQKTILRELRTLGKGRKQVRGGASLRRELQPSQVTAWSVTATFYNTKRRGQDYSVLEFRVTEYSSVSSFSSWGV